MVIQKLNRTIEDLYPKYCAFLSDLVRIPSPIGEEAEAQDFVAKTMKQLGLDVDVFDLDTKKLKNCPGFVYDDRNYKNRPLVVGTYKGKKKQSLILNAHIDTAPIGDLRDWVCNPTGGEIKDGKLWGRGAWDDKAGIAIMLLIFESFIKCGISLEGDLILQSVIEDETTGNGTLACLERGHTASNEIILDGTWAERIIESHMGQMWFDVEISGRSAPACVSFRAENPINHIAPILKAFKTLVEKKNSQLTQPWGTATSPIFINVGRVSSGFWPGSVPTRCTLECQTGFCPPQTIKVVREEIKECLQKAAEDDVWLKENPPTLYFRGLSTDPIVGPENNPVLQGIREEVRHLRGKDVKVIPVTGHADIRHFYSHSIPACLYGPGEGGNAHIENEYYVVDQMPIVAQNIASYIFSLWNH